MNSVVVEKPTIVFVHGVPAWYRLTFRGELKPLADITRLVLYDHRGLGRSDRSWRTLDRWAADLRRPMAPILGGDRNPMTTEHGAFAPAVAFRPGLASLEVLVDCGLGPLCNRPEATLASLCGFIVDGTPNRSLTPCR